ncbi:MAG: HD family phosphohydrolase [Candidatus Limnocylindrales bacterium]
MTVHPQLKEPGGRPRLFGRPDAVRLILSGALILMALGVGVAVDLAPSNPGLAAGAIAPTTIRAPRDASIANQVETAQAQDAAAKAVLPQYDFTSAGASVKAAAQVDQLQIALLPVDDAFTLAKTPAARETQLQAVLPSLSAGERATLLGLDPSRWLVVERAAETALGKAEQVEIRKTDPAAQTSLLTQYLPTDAGLSAAEQSLAVAVAAPFVVPNSAYSDTLTAQARAQAAASQGTIQDTLQAGQVIVDQGHVVTEADMVKIKFFGLDTSRIDWGKSGAWILIAALTTVLLLGWLWRSRPEYWHRGRTLVLIGVVFVVAVLAEKLPGGRTWLPYIVPVAAAGMLLTVLLDVGVATVVLALLAVLAGIVNGTSLELTAYVFLGGFAGMLAIGKGERQYLFLRAGLAVAVTDFVVVGVFAMLGQYDMTGLLEVGGAAAAGALVATVITIGTFSLLGNVFGILTPPQLSELVNPSQPLLRRLLIETPGTYHHSLMVGNLAERAASAIGADPMLARVAAYYHDIGKLANPLAFIENQAGGENIHEQLEPEVSATILRQHVRDGLDLAYKARLPEPLIAFIPQHHGTAILGYVYGKARDAAAAPFGGLKTPAGREAADAVDQSQFRHGGPKPQSREAAVLMLADGVEASVRSLSSRDEATIRGMVSQIIQERLGDGQLNECDLTIRDLESIHEAFVGQLLGMYHQRIAYPANKVVEIESRRERGLRK